MEFILNEADACGDNSSETTNNEFIHQNSFIDDSPFTPTPPPPDPWLEEDEWKLYMKAKIVKERTEQLFNERPGDLKLPANMRPPPPSQALYDVKTHWKCLFCEKIFSKNTRKSQHEKTCQKKGRRQEILNDIVVENGNVVSIEKKKENKDLVKCYICKESISRSNISRHVKLKHHKEKDPNTPNRKRGRPKLSNVQCTMCNETLSKSDLKDHYYRVHNTSVPPEESSNGKKKGRQSNKKKKGTSLFYVTSKYHLKHYMRRVMEGNIPVRTTKFRPIRRFSTKTVCLFCKVPFTSHAGLRGHYIACHKTKCYGHGAFPNYSLTFTHAKIKPRILRRVYEYSTIGTRTYLIQTGTSYCYKTTNIRGYRNHLVFKGNGLERKLYINDDVTKWNVKLYSRRNIIQQFAAGNETGIGNYHHCHIFFRSTRKHMKIESFRRFILRRNRFLTEISAAKSEKKVVKYVTKEDEHAVVINIDKEVCHRRWQFNYIFENTDCISKTSYKAMKWDSKFSKDEFNAYIDARRDEYFKDQALERCKNSMNDYLLETLNLCEKKGIWIVGPPGVGKSSTVMCYTKGKYFELPEKINQFMFDGWNGEEIIVAEDVSVAWAENIRRTINSLTDDRGLCIGERKGGAKFNVCIKKFICTSNEGPPTWDGFERRFNVIVIMP